MKTYFYLAKRLFSFKKIKNHNIIYWEDILKQIIEQKLDKENIFINEFCKILAYRWFDFKKIIFKENELDLIFSGKKEEGYKMLENVNIPILMNKLFQIIVDTKVGYYKKIRKALNKDMIILDTF
ncbi:hypothetical protein [Aliarcobacter cryaerophilus]|uniref:hypothetical protein n=1 Tax=Aliarcobacter cryaerophilus TaxID=28198 RepID=UPI002094D539|nr:hypothetical protein [Aliarcobacter cryaerophilus]